MNFVAGLSGVARINRRIGLNHPRKDIPGVTADAANPVSIADTHFAHPHAAIPAEAGATNR